MQLSARKKKLIRLAAISILIDFAASAIELPFFAEWIVILPLKEMIEQFISSLLVRHELKLSAVDRILGLCPIPGVTAVTIRVTRELFKKD